MVEVLVLLVMSLRRVSTGQQQLRGPPRLKAARSTTPSQSIGTRLLPTHSLVHGVGVLSGRSGGHTCLPLTDRRLGALWGYASEPTAADAGIHAPSAGGSIMQQDEKRIVLTGAAMPTFSRLSVGLYPVGGTTHPGFQAPRARNGWRCEQHLDNLRRKDSLRGAETTEVSVRLGSYSASHFAGSACDGVSCSCGDGAGRGGGDRMAVAASGGPGCWGKPGHRSCHARKHGLCPRR